MKQLFYDLFITGLSGWVFVLLGFLVTGAAFYLRRSKQTNIKAKGDVAGGDIIKNSTVATDKPSGTREARIVSQNNIVAGGDVAGGDIKKDCR